MTARPPLVAGKPVIGIILDENTSTGGDRYEAGKGYFAGVERAGGVAVGLPYAADSVAFAESACAGLISTGARVRFPDAFYVDGEASRNPASDRFDVEAALVARFLELDRPYLGICNGMQLLGCLSGGRMTGRAVDHVGEAIAHDDPATRHPVRFEAGGLLARIHGVAGGGEVIVNSFHREAILTPPKDARVVARAPDGLIEAIERPDKTFPVGVQWHPERMLDEQAHAQALFDAFTGACGTFDG